MCPQQRYEIDVIDSSLKGMTLVLRHLAMAMSKYDTTKVFWYPVIQMGSYSMKFNDGPHLDRIVAQFALTVDAVFIGCQSVQSCAQQALRSPSL